MAEDDQDENLFRVRCSADSLILVSASPLSLAIPDGHGIFWTFERFLWGLCFVSNPDSLYQNLTRFMRDFLVDVVSVILLICS